MCHISDEATLIVTLYYGSTFKFRGGTSLPKPNLSTIECRALAAT